MKHSKTLMVLMAWSSSLWAHNFVEDNSGWCHNDTQEIGQVELTSQQLKDYVEYGVQCSVPLVPAGHFEEGSEDWHITQYIRPAFHRLQSSADDLHGEIDDPDFWENDYRVGVAHAMCACAVMNGNEYMDSSRVRPLLTTDTATSSTHHSDYAVGDGMQFSCQVCPSQLRPMGMGGKN